MHRYSFFLLDKALSIRLASPLSFLSRYLLMTRCIISRASPIDLFWSQMAQSLDRTG